MSRKGEPTRRQSSAHRAAASLAGELQAFRHASAQRFDRIRAERRAAREEREDQDKSHGHRHVPAFSSDRWVVHHTGETRASRRARQIARGRVFDPDTKQDRWPKITPSTNVPHRNPARDRKPSSRVSRAAAP
jgi:hypothetical protein